MLLLCQVYLSLELIVSYLQSLETQNQALRRRCANLEDEVQTLRVGLAEVRQHILLKQQPQQHQHQQQQPQLPATPANARQEPIQRAPSRSNKVSMPAKVEASCVVTCLLLQHCHAGLCAKLAWS